MSLEPGIEKGIPCPAPISRLRVEKIEGGLVVAGVVVAANCQVALPVFGFLFILVGIVLTVASYRGPGKDEAPENYEARLAFTGNSRILGPACIVVGFIMLAAGVGLCLLTRKARRRERRVGFHCPVHGDFYPLSPVSAPRTLTGKLESRWGSWFTRNKHVNVESIARTPPQCPHTQFSSTRSSFSSNPPSPCPTPMPFLVTSGSISSGLVNSIGINLSPDQTFGSIRSLSVSREVASFPLSRTPSPPPNERSPSRSSSVEDENREVFETEKEAAERNNNNNNSATVRNITNNNNNRNCVNNNNNSTSGGVGIGDSAALPGSGNNNNNNNNRNKNNNNSVINGTTTIDGIPSGRSSRLPSAGGGSAHHQSASLSTSSGSSPEAGGDNAQVVVQRESIAQIQAKAPRKSVSIILPDEENG